ncbi:coenzyme F420-reducing hydrogenase gamma subunit [Hydrogenivirga caldilitoris]|uniref:Coenzyme F420-reducing hydrogenase gamma subunit n=1 Tax=Hydrogenivirga caldilitoris TaxID=246264 RepID=A0A497XNM4_9AQUI|nr:oxidoreductase [Hydrogenivirga caldilitoris]RLJ70468.1 coenzyme F420-reducing hydrogenase gamma subunit [Hydrogenivirga caldilitoris]
MDKLRVGVFKFSSCDGCQAVFLDLPQLWDYLDFRYWLLGRSKRVLEPLDIAFVEGSVSTQEEAEFIREIREKTRVLVTIGACATSGGIQALRNFKNMREFTSLHPEGMFIRVLDKSTPVKEHVKVDYEIYGCPINPQILEGFIKAILYNKKPVIPDYPLCMEYKLRGNVCVMDAYSIPCLGPIVKAGCGALCPSVKRGCYGCFGPCKEPNVESLINWFKGIGLKEGDIISLFENENAYADEFRKVLEGKVEGSQD